MNINIILPKLIELYDKLEEGLYSYGDYPAPEEKFIRNDPHVSISTLIELSDVITNIDNLLGGSDLTGEVIELIREDSPIFNLVKFDEQEYAMELLNKNIEAYDENLELAQENASQQAYEIKSELLDKAIEDIKRLMEEILPSIINNF